jgi:hypothetical protein
MQWARGYGINSLYLQFHHLAFGRIRTLRSDFVDIREEVRRGR